MPDLKKTARLLFDLATIEAANEYDRVINAGNEPPYPVHEFVSRLTLAKIINEGRASDVEAAMAAIGLPSSASDINRALMLARNESEERDAQTVAQ